ELVEPAAPGQRMVDDDSRRAPPELDAEAAGVERVEREGGGARADAVPVHGGERTERDQEEGGAGGRPPAPAPVEEQDAEAGQQAEPHAPRERRSDAERDE